MVEVSGGSIFPLSEVDVERVRAIIEAAYHAGYEAGKSDAARNADNLQQLRELIKQQRYNTLGHPVKDE